jgi:alpha-glucoside transport system substrate-binding protein
VNGQQPWSSAEITRAFQTFGQIVADDAVFGGASGAISTDFKKAGDPLFADPPGCLLMAQGSFMIPFLSGSTRTVGADFDFFPTPQLNPAFDGAVVGGGDLVGLFSQKPAAQNLIAFLVSAEGQARWVASGGALSINSRVLTYPTDVAKRAASMLVSARQFRFDGSDQMPTAMNDAFLKAILDFTSDQRRLPDLLAELDAVRESAYGR